ncbi:MAG: domain containing protein, partial [Solirubrobacterales bacterium]|nr:domain containing protein [Solirubrobacterales bacterium]
AVHLASEAFGGAPAHEPRVEFRRSGVSVAWDASLPSLLDLADRHGVPSGAACRVGSCQGCRTAVLAGEVEGGEVHGGSALLCCTTPRGDLVLDA